MAQEQGTDWGKVSGIVGIIGVLVAIIAILVAHADAMPHSTDTPDSSRAAPVPTSTPAPVPQQAQPVSTSGIRHEGELVLRNGDSADLDSPQNNGQWNPAPSGLTDIWNSKLGLTYANYTAWAVFPGQAVDYPTCLAHQSDKSARNYAESTQPTTEVSVGENICWRTNENRYSALTVTKVDDTAITFHVVTYETQAPPL